MQYGRGGKGEREERKKGKETPHCGNLGKKAENINPLPEKRVGREVGKGKKTSLFHFFLRSPPLAGGEEKARETGRTS